MGSATAITPSVILLVPKDKMVELLHKQHAMSDRFISHMLSRNIRIEEDLIDQLFNSSEKRLARALLLLARYGKPDKPIRVVPKISQETLAGNDWHDALASEFLPEQVQAAGLHRLQRRTAAQDQQLAAERRPARLTYLYLGAHSSARAKSSSRSRVFFVSDAACSNSRRASARRPSRNSRSPRTLGSR